MPISKNPYKRYRIIDGMLRRRFCPSKREIMEKLSQEGYPISERCFENDLEALRSKMNLPVEYDRYQNGYYYTDENARLDVVFTDDEIELIWLAVSNFNQAEDLVALSELRCSIERLMRRMYIVERSSKINDGDIDRSEQFRMTG